MINLDLSLKNVATKIKYLVSKVHLYQSNKYRKIKSIKKQDKNAVKCLCRYFRVKSKTIAISKTIKEFKAGLNSFNSNLETDKDGSYINF